MSDEQQPLEEFDDVDERPFNMVYFRRILGYLQPYRPQVALTAFGILLASGVTLFEPYLLGRVVDDGIIAADMAAVQRLVAMIVGLRLVNWVGRYIRVRIINRTGQDVLFDLRQELFEHIQTLSVRFYDRHPVGRIMSRITSDVSAIANLLNNGLSTLVAEAIGLVGVLAVMLWMSWQLTLIAFVTVPILSYLLIALRQPMQLGWKNVRKSVSNISTYLNESINGIEVTQAFARQPQNIGHFGGLSQASHDRWMETMRTHEMVWPAVEMVGVVGTALVVVAGGWLVINGSLTLGFIMAFISYLWLFWQPLSGMSKVYGLVLSAMASAERIFEFLDEQPEVFDRPNAEPLPTVQGRVRYEQLAFRYRDDQPLVLKDINLDVAPGETIAFVGHTGSGKTTMVSLLLRYYDVTEGRITIDGHDLRDVQLASLRQQMSIVLQDGFVFSGSVADNIRYGRLDATDEEVAAVAQAVGLHEFITSLEEGYNHEVGERGNRLSVGQRQLIAFARALIANPRILILDEATSNIDAETEEQIQHAMRTLLENRTAFIIAHRLSTIRDADRIVVMNQGRIAEIGSHQALLARRGRYFNLYVTQFAGRRPAGSNGAMVAELEGALAEAGGD